MTKRSLRRCRAAPIGGGVLAAVLVFPLGGCGAPDLPPSGGGSVGGEPVHVGSSACAACHSNVAALHGIHGHSQALKPIQSGPPDYPDAAPDAGVPDPPPGLEWFDVSYVIGGYSTAASFVDANGYLLVHGETGEPFYYHLRHLPSGVRAGFRELREEELGRSSFEFEHFQRYTTGAQRLSDNGGRRQGNRPGIEGTWFEDGVQCEACHGPGSLHIPNPSLGNIRVDTSAEACAACHSLDGENLLAEGGFILAFQQFAEMRASPHESFTCTVCHDPHASARFEPATGLRNGCRDCHADMDLARHDGQIFVQGDYVERLGCESCHMPFASKLASSASDEVTGGLGGRIGDMRTHIMRIDTDARDFTAMIDAQAGQVVAGPSGSVAVTLDYVCLRCHNGMGNAFVLTVGSAAQIAAGLHGGQ